MNGVELAKYIDDEISNRGLKKKTFYHATGITSATLSQWRTGTYNPSEENVEAVEKFFGVSFQFSVETKKDLSAMDDEEVDKEMYEIMSEIKSNPDIRALMKSARGSSRESLRVAAKMLDYYKNGGADAD